MQTTFVAYWYDPAMVEARARKHGWDGDDGLLDYYHPEDDPNGHEAKSFRSLSGAVDHLKAIILAGQEFWGQGKVCEIQKVSRRCAACTCRGYRTLREFTVEDCGVVDERTVNECVDD